MFRELYTDEYVEKMSRAFDENDVEMTTVKLMGEAHTTSHAVVDGHELDSFELLYITTLAVVNLAADVIAKAGPGFYGEVYADTLGAMITGAIKGRIHDS